MKDKLVVDLLVGDVAVTPKHTARLLSDACGGAEPPAAIRDPTALDALTRLVRHGLSSHVLFVIRAVSLCL